MRFPSTVVLAAAAMLLPPALLAQKTITGQAAFADWNQQQPGVRRKITSRRSARAEAGRGRQQYTARESTPGRRVPHCPGELQSLPLCGPRPQAHAASGQQAGDGRTSTTLRLIRRPPNGDSLPCRVGGA
jgi:hypothetical protein